MSGPQPAISVVIPLFNAEPYISETLDSVAQQQIESLEVIVIDDGSTDSSSTIVQNHPLELTYVFQENQGAAGARNAGISRARGKYIAFLDADDKWPDNKLLSQQAMLESNPEFSAVAGRTQFIGSLELLRHKERMQLDENNVAYYPILLGSVLYRREVFEQIGLFDTSLRNSEDFDFHLRVRDAELIVHQQNEIVLFYRIHGSGLVSKSPGEGWSFPEIIRRSIQRKRAAQQGN